MRRFVEISWGIRPPLLGHILYIQKVVGREILAIDFAIEPDFGGLYFEHGGT